MIAALPVARAGENEQEAGIEQINQAIIETDTVTQQNAALVKQAAAAAEALRDQAGHLARAVSVFKLDAQGAPLRVRSVARVPPRKAVPAKTHVAMRKAASGGQWEAF